VRLEGLGQLKKIHLIGTRTRDLPVCSIVPQPTTLPRAPQKLKANLILVFIGTKQLVFYMKDKPNYRTVMFSEVANSENN
jgi:hypothetical protein